MGPPTKVGGLFFYRDSGAERMTAAQEL